jgi:hypothetical protein
MALTGAVLVATALGLDFFRAGALRTGANHASLSPLVRERPFIDDPPLPVDGIGVATLGEIKQASGLICGPAQGAGSDASNVNTDCDASVGSVAPHHETTMAVNPTNPANLIAGANDSQFLLTNGGALKITALAHERRRRPPIPG